MFLKKIKVLRKDQLRYKIVSSFGLLVFYEKGVDFKICIVLEIVYFLLFFLDIVMEDEE